ncbi:hypothetical protein BUALT_Bualt04G0019200 [Buddleja alternifolia]|uniref:Uncharacterized protein n=1 Tax=Buddleja alternifolia TaxID=168488 RepID=A0AAV6XPU9_9LAMI|nr:hypothetical protein BUALT_Bualt04G0019200 [Buddleja alternifolia]
MIFLVSGKENSQEIDHELEQDFDDAMNFFDVLRPDFRETHANASLIRESIDAVISHQIGEMDIDSKAPENVASATQGSETNETDFISKTMGQLNIGESSSG